MKQKLPDITTDFSGWYHEVIRLAELADEAPVRGCIVMRPYGYALWEEIKAVIDAKIKKTGHQNAAFPLLIPESFLKREADHVAGFSPELAVVTHAGGKELEEPLVVRPTSETIIHYMFARWLKSWRDLPIKINQWASVVRWEMRTRPFLRTTEFWWQEGHTAHETAAEAHAEVLMMLEEYRDLAERYLAIPVVTGPKTPKERFAGADVTMTFEGLMPDGKALQMGTSHAISQNFAHAFEMKFQDRGGNIAYPYLTSWGTTTRLIGAVIMMHGDQKGLVLPPAIAPYHILIVPIVKSGEQHSVTRAAIELSEELSTKFRVEVDMDDQRTPGAKFYRGELRGIPLRIELGTRDIESGTLVVVDRLTSTKRTIARTEILSSCGVLLAEIQALMFKRADDRRKEQWHRAATLEEIITRIETDRGFYEIAWCGDTLCELRLTEAKASIRCLLSDKIAEGPCFVCGRQGIHVALAARSY